MANLLELIDDHSKLEGYIGELEQLVEGQAARVEQGFDTLRNFSHALDRHLAAEASFLYADHLRADPSRLDHEISAFEKDFADLKGEWKTYLTEWTEENIAADWSGFATATLWMMSRMRERIEQENGVLYPLALRESRIAFRPH